MQKSNHLLKILIDDKSLITYRPRLNQITGSVQATILLQQILYRWDNNSQEAFYKFKEPCNHALYIAGDSWCEELGFKKSEFDNAIGRIGFKVKKGSRLSHNSIVEYWTNIQRLTYYQINEVNLQKALNSLYIENQDIDLCKANKTKPYVNQNSDLDNTHSEITSDIEKKIKNKKAQLQNAYEKKNKQKKYYSYVNRVRKLADRYRKLNNEFVLFINNRRYGFEYKEDGNHYLKNLDTNVTLSKDDAEYIYKVLAHKNEIPLNQNINL